MTAEQALALAREKFGRGARVILVALGDPVVAEADRERARRELAEHQKRKPKLIQTDSAPPDMTMREYEFHRRAWWEAHQKHQEREDELQKLAYGFSMYVGGSELYADTACHYREPAHTWEEALERAGISVDSLIQQRPSVEDR